MGSERLGASRRTETIDMIAQAARKNLLNSQIDKAAILASYEQGLFTVGNLAVLLENYCAMQEIAREGEPISDLARQIDRLAEAVTRIPSSISVTHYPAGYREPGGYGGIAGGGAG
jgi:hypothetical protein